MSSVVDKVRRSVAKTIQVASENEAYDGLPECEELLLANKFTIKIRDMSHDNKTASASASQNVIHFEINAKGSAGGGKYFVGELICGQGIVVKTIRGKTAMEIRLPDNSKTCMGKILHPSGATLFKVDFGTNLPLGNEWHILKNGQPFLNMVTARMEEVFGILRNPLHFCICVNGDYSIDFFKLDNESVAFVRPSIFTKRRSIELEYKIGSTSRDERAAILGAAILFLIVTVYPHYGELLGKAVPHI